MPLDTIVMETDASPNAAIIWMHGLGADAHDFEPVVPELVQRRERAWRFVFPNATPRAVTINGGAPMRAWYDIFGMNRHAREDETGLRDSGNAIKQLIDAEVLSGIPANRIVLAGFSQGGAVALFTALRYPERLAGVMALSTYLPLAHLSGTELSAANRGTSIFMAHGLADGVLPVAMGRESRDVLQKVGFTVEWHQYPMAHSLCASEIADMRHYLFRVLPQL